MRAETVGLDGNALVLGKHSGRHALRARLEAMGHELSDDEFRHVFARFKDIADRKKVVEERDLEALVVGEVRRAASALRAPARAGVVRNGTHSHRYRATRGSGRRSAHGVGAGHGAGRCGVRRDQSHRRRSRRARGVRRHCRHRGNQRGGRGHNARARAESAGVASFDEAPDVQITDAERSERFPVYSGNGVHVDIVVAAAEAYLSALNRLFHARRRQQHSRRSCSRCNMNKRPASIGARMFVLQRSLS